MNDIWEVIKEKDLWILSVMIVVVLLIYFIGESTSKYRSKKRASTHTQEKKIKITPRQEKELIALCEQKAREHETWEGQVRELFNSKKSKPWKRKRADQLRANGIEILEVILTTDYKSENTTFAREQIAVLQTGAHQWYKTIPLLYYV